MANLYQGDNPNQLTNPFQQKPAQAGFFSPMANPYQLRQPQTNAYKSQLDSLLTNPSSFSGTPGFQFALDQGLNAVQRSNSAGRNSGNALAALANYGQGLATQDYGNQVDRLGRLSGQQDQFNLGTEQNRLSGENNINQFNLGGERNFNDAQNNANQFSLGQQQNFNTATRNANDFTLGGQQNFNTATRNANDLRANDQQYGLGMFNGANQFQLGREQNANTAQNNWWNNQNNMAQNANTAALNQNNFNLGMGQNQIGMFNAQTQRGNGMGQNYNQDQMNQLNWAKYYNPNPWATYANSINGGYRSGG